MTQSNNNKETVINRTSYSGCDIKVYCMVSDLYYNNLKKDVQNKLHDINGSIDTLQRTIAPKDKLTQYQDDAYANNKLMMGDLFSETGDYSDYNSIAEAKKDLNGLKNRQSSLINKIGNETVFVELAELQTISYSVYRDKAGVRVLGQDSVTGFTRGGSTVAGTMIFTVFHERILHEILNQSLADNPNPVNLSLLRVDMLPPLDIFVTFENELGQQSRLSIYGVEFLNEGQVMSINDLITENSVNYVARHLSPMRQVNTTLPDQYDMDVAAIIHGMSLTKDDYKQASDELAEFKKRFL